MAIFFYKRYIYLKCLVITIITAFFVQILISVLLIPLDNEEIYSKKIFEIHSLIRKDSPKNNAKFATANVELNFEDLNFIPPCKIENREAISAIHRAKTQSCKKEIVNITCLSQSGKLYPVSLPNKCLSVDMTYGKYLGCYQDEKKARLFSSYYGNFVVTNSPDACLDICIQSGFPYAGVQYGSECFCGENLSLSLKIPETLCNMSCPADNSKYCGGYFTMNVYETGLPKFQPKSPKSSIMTNETINIVFLLTLNGRALRQVYRLINVLYRSNHYFYIHVDSRQHYLYRELMTLEKKFKNIKLTRTRYSTIWGGASLLQMLLNAMKDFSNFGWKWDFVINLSESDFPIKSLESLEQFLSVNKGLNFVKSHGREVQRFIKKQGLDKTFIECDTHMWRIGERKLPKGVVIDGGSDWVALSSEFVTYITGFQDDLLSGLSQIFKYTLLPAESFFHTVLRNSQFCNRYVDNNLHVTNWKRKLGCKCQYKHVVDWCGCSPNVFLTEDWPRIQSTLDKQVFFARKFEPIINQQIITKVEQLIGFNDHDFIRNIQGYWQNIYHIEDLTSATDDLLQSHAASIMRLNAKNLLKEKCSIELGDIIEINSYNFEDIYKGNLILYKAIIDNKHSVLVETWYKPIKQLDLKSDYSGINVFKTLKVSSDYDQKETIFRNYGNILGPLSEPVLLMQPFEKFINNLTVIWLDPAGAVADVAIVMFDENNQTQILKPNIKSPFLPGVWKVGLFKNLDLISVTSFLITPLEYSNGKEVSEVDVNMLHSGSQNTYKNFSLTFLSSFIPTTQESVKLKQTSNENINKTRQSLRGWIEQLSENFYSVITSCVSNFNRKVIQCGTHKFQSCSDVDWSSKSVDPKGFVGTLNKQTGRLERT